MTQEGIPLLDKELNWNKKPILGDPGTDGGDEALFWTLTRELGALIPLPGTGVLSWPLGLSRGLPAANLQEKRITYEHRDTLYLYLKVLLQGATVI